MRYLVSNNEKFGWASQEDGRWLAVTRLPAEVAIIITSLLAWWFLGFQRYWVPSSGCIKWRWQALSVSPPGRWPCGVLVPVFRFPCWGSIVDRLGCCWCWVQSVVLRNSKLRWMGLALVYVIVGPVPPFFCHCRLLGSQLGSLSVVPSSLSLCLDWFSWPDCSEAFSAICCRNVSEGIICTMWHIRLGSFVRTIPFVVVYQGGVCRVLLGTESIVQLSVILPCKRSLQGHQL